MNIFTMLYSLRDWSDSIGSFCSSYRYQQFPAHINDEAHKHNDERNNRVEGSSLVCFHLLYIQCLGLDQRPTLGWHSNWLSSLEEFVRSGFHSCSIHSSLDFHSRSSSGVVLKMIRAPGNTLGDNSGDRATEPVMGNVRRQGCNNTWGLGSWKIMKIRRTFLLISEIHRVIFKTENNKI